MMKPQQKTIKKGDYYQIQAYQQTMMLISKSKRQQIPIISSTNIPVSQYLTSDIPNFSTARQKYFNDVVIREQNNGNKSLVELKNQLIMLGGQEGLNDQDRKEIQRLMEEIEGFMDSRVVELNEMIVNRGEEKEEMVKSEPYSRFNLNARFNVKSLNQQIQRIQQIDFPQLHNLQHQLQVMLGQKKPVQTVQIQISSIIQKEQLSNIYNHLTSLTVLNNMSETINSIMLNQPKHVEMKIELQKNQQISNFHNDFLTELQGDTSLVDKLEQNFKRNIQQVKGIIKEVKEFCKK